VLGFTLHNTTEGIGIASPILEERPPLASFAGLTLLAGGPAVIGLWIGSLAYAPQWSALALAIGAGAILQVIVEVTLLLARGSGQTPRSILAPSAMAGLAAGVVAAVSRLDVSQALRAALVGTITAILSPVGLALALPPGGDADTDGAERACLAPHVLGPLAELPPARVLASFNLGAHLLAHTPHSVFAAPYHRNNHGNRIAAEAFLAPPEAAEALLRKAGVGLVVWCPQAKSSPLVSTAPQGLAAMLARGEAPAYLARQPLAATPLLVFALRPVE
jgi:hypothetical protein